MLRMSLGEWHTRNTRMYVMNTYAGEEGIENNRTMFVAEGEKENGCHTDIILDKTNIVESA